MKKILIISSDDNLRKKLSSCFNEWGYDVVILDSYSEDITLIKKISPDIIVIDINFASLIDLKICNLLKEDFLTASIPIITLINKPHLKSHLLNIKQGVDDYLIKPPDALDLRIRVEMALRRAKFSLHSSPLTGLPGGRIIEEVLKERIEGGIDLSVGYLDIDNFKYFNDVYGYLKGDSVIMQTAYMLYNTIRKYGNSNDFIAHIGGDDFIFITSQDKYKTICQNFISAFDGIIPFHYNDRDRKRGFIITRDRNRQVKQIPLMSVSVAVVNVKKPSRVKNIIQINERFIEIKKYLKTIPGSKYMADRRDQIENNSFGPRINKRDEEILDSYRPLGQVLVERNIISSENLERALRTHWKRGIVLGEVLREMGLVKEEQLQEALHTQMNVPLSS